MSPLPPDEAAAAQLRLQELRGNGSWRADPARFRYLEALSRRVDGQPEPVRGLLQAKLQAGVSEYTARLAQRPPSLPRRSGPRVEPSPLGELNRALHEARPQADLVPGREELASARRFRAAWDAQRALENLELALAHKPRRAGPLNSHALILQSLELMRALSPRYLRQFVLHVETLQWLAATGEPPAAQAPKAKKAAKSAKVVKARPKK